jgi:hypothetical protein
MLTSLQELLTGIGGIDLTILYKTHPAPPTTAAFPNCEGWEGLVNAGKVHN